MIGLPGKCPSAAGWFAAKCQVADPVAGVLSDKVTSFPRLRDQTSNVLTRKFAKSVARQRGHNAERPRQESNVDAPTQFSQDIFGAAFGRHREGDEPIDRACIAFV